MTATMNRRTLLGTMGAMAGAAVMGEAVGAQTMPADIIDVHTHAIQPIWRKSLAASLKIDPKDVSIAGYKLPQWSPEQHVGYMDRQGIAAGVLSLPEGTTMLRGTAARELARAMNQGWADIIKAHPTRFGAFATVPLDDIEAAVKETRYALDVLKLDGVASTCHFDGAYLGDPRYDPWFAELNKRKAVLFVHPSMPKAMDQVFVGPNGSTLEFMFDTTRMVTKLVITGTKARYPDIRIISTHGGGTIPYLAHRIAISDVFFGPGMGLPKMTEAEVTAGLASFYYDLTASTSGAQLDAMFRLVPKTQLMLGFDYPMMPENLTAPEIASFNAYPGLTDAERKAIRASNALKLFPMLAKRRGA